MKILNVLVRSTKEFSKSLRLMWRNSAGRAGLSLFLLIILVSYVGPVFVPLPKEADISNIYSGPTLQHPLGTNEAGKDNLALIINGGKDVMLVAFVAGLITVVIAVLIGSISAFVGGRVDTVLMEFVNVWLTIPQFPLLAVLASLIKFSSPLPLALMLGCLSWAGLARQIRSQVLSLRKREFVEAAVTLDMGTRHVLLKELLPNMMSYIAISLVFAMTSAIFQQTGLIFLGIVPLAGANWGVMLSIAYSKGAVFNARAAWTLAAPVLMIVLFELSLVLMSRSLDDAFNPRLRTEV